MNHDHEGIGALLVLLITSAALWSSLVVELGPKLLTPLSA
jgi:hypothetical protein